MNIPASECSESGWTMYLDQQTNSADHQYNRIVSGGGGGGGKVVVSGEDEDLSMVSDASSGPPHFHDFVGYSSSSGLEHKKEKQRKKTEEENQNCFLDDTASSPAMTFPIEHVPGMSETQFKGKSVLGKHFGFLKSSGKTTTKKCGGVKERNKK